MQKFITDPSEPMTQAAAVTPHNTNPLAFTSRGLSAGADGAIALRMSGDAADVTITVKAGFFYPLCVTHIRATGTVATGICIFQ